MTLIPEEIFKPSVRLPKLFSRSVAAHELQGPARLVNLHPSEAACIPAAAEKRRAEFSTGRACARLALADVGFADFPILMGERRSPVWPDALVGSITHADGYCGAVVARRDCYRGIGVDAERLNRLKPEAERLICTEEERVWLSKLEGDERILYATTLFSAKEAFYKCQFALTRGWLGFREVQVEFDGAQFEIRLIVPGKLPELDSEVYVGRFLVEENHVFTGIAIEA